MNAQVLVVGAGAVGQVFGQRFQRGGASLTFFVRDKYKEEVARGFDMYRLPAFGGRQRVLEPERFEGFDVVTTADEVSKRRFDHVVLTVASHAMRGPWLGEFARAIGDEATIVSLQPAADDRVPILEAGIAAERVVSGMISLVAYDAPLPGETRFRSPGMAYWFPPMSPSPFSGSPSRVSAVVELLTRGGLPARRHPDVPRLSGFPTAIGMAYLTALEAAGWSIAKFVRGPLLALGVRAGAEARAIVAKTHGSAPLAARLGGITTLVRIGAYFAEMFAPFPLEEYLRKHFTKVAPQTRLIIASLIEQGRGAELPVVSLEALAASVE